MNKELEELQTHIAFQEHTIAELNVALIDQQKQLDVFRIELRLLQEKLAELDARPDSIPSGPGQERPPHY